MRAGALRQRITIQRASEGRNEYGEITRSWSAVKTVWASVQPLRGQELVNAKQVDARASHRITIRYDAAIALTPKDRILFGARTINIADVINVEERNHTWEITGTEPL